MQMATGVDVGSVGTDDKSFSESQQIAARRGIVVILMHDMSQDIDSVKRQWSDAMQRSS